jgi:hydrogenase maturation protease
MPTGGCLIVGIGNADRGDDAVGRLVARKLARHAIPGVRVVEHGGESAGLLDCLAGAEAAYVIDACRMGRRAGSVSRFDAAAAPLPRGAVGCSTHGLGLAEAIELARALGRLPRRCVVYAIEGRTYDFGAALSPEAAAAAEEVANLIRKDVCDREAG